MTKPLTIFFLLMTLLVTEAGKQAMRLPLLWNHYKRHLTQGRSDNLVDFLKEHYLEHHDEDGDEKQDSELPFKTVNADSFSGVYIPSAMMHVEQYAGKASEMNLYPDCFVLQLLDDGIFHPPQLCFHCYVL